MRARPTACASAAVGAALLVLLLSGACVQASSDGAPRRQLLQTTLDLTATNTVGGKTPEIVAVNLGHRYPGSNWAKWMSRLRVNSARVFLTALWGSSLEGFVGSTNWGKDLKGTSVTSLPLFQTAVAELRTPAGHNPASAGYANPVRWSKFDTNFVTTDTASKGDEQEGNHNATLATLASLPTLTYAPLVVIGCGAGSVRDSAVMDTTSAAYWKSHWEVYKHFYAFSRYLWLRGITRIELYNEPDLDNDYILTSGAFDEVKWLDHMRVRARAIQDAFADLNAESPARPALLPDIHVGAFAKTQYNGGKLGQPSVQALHRTFAAAADPDPAWSNFNTYTYHSYGQSGKSILANFQELYANFSASDKAAYGALRFAVTEHNAKTSGDFSTSTLNMDAASQATKLASQLVNYVTVGENLQALYVFKFSVTLSSSNGVTKNGVHWGDNTGAPYHVSDSALGAEGLRMVAEHLAGAKDILSLTSAAAASLTNTKAVAVRSGRNYYIYVVNTGSAAVPVTLNLASWGIGASVPVTVERLSASSYGEVTNLLFTATGGTLSGLSLGVDELVRIKVPVAGAAVVQSTVVARGSAHVRAGSSSNTNYAATTMCVGSSKTTHASSYASVMQFTVANATNVTSAVLRLTVSSLSAALSANMPMQLLGFANTAWSPTAITWNGLVTNGGPLLTHPPAGSATSWDWDKVAENPINWNSPGLTILGHVTLPSGLSTSAAVSRQQAVDVTEYVRAAPGSAASFLLLRPVRNNLETATGDTIAADTLNGGARACFHSATASTAANRPRLFVQYG